MSGQLGEGSTHQSHKDGWVTGGMKYAEGQLIALNDLRRKLNALSEMADDAALRRVLDAEMARWRDGLEVQRQRPKPAMPWLACYTMPAWRKHGRPGRPTPSRGQARLDDSAALLSEAM